MGGWILLNFKLDALHGWHDSDIILAWTFLSSVPLLIAKDSYFQQTDCMSSLVISICIRRAL